MKKLMTIGMAAAVLFTFAGQAKATALETSGEIRARGWYVDNYVSSGRSTEWFDERLRLNLVWPVAEGVKVSVRADILEGFWGENNEAFSATFNTATNTISSKTAGFGTRPPINFDHVNMEFKWPGTPLTFYLGRMDVSWGPGFAVKSDNRDRIKIMAAFSPELTLGFTYDKNSEIFGAHDGPGGVDDGRGWGLLAVGKVAGWSYGVIGSYVLNETVPGTKATTYITDAYVMGKAGLVDTKFELAYYFGNTKTTGKPTVDMTGLGAYVGMSMPAGPVTIGLEGAYASGNDLSTAKNEGGFKSEYQSPFWSIILFTNLDVPGYQQLDNKLTSDFGADTGLQNAVGGKMTVTVAPAKGLKIILAGVYAQSLEDISVTDKAAVAAVPASLNLDGTVKPGTAAVAATTKTVKAGSMGTEFDLIAVYNITDNVYFLGGFGYLVAGDVFGNVDNPMGVMGSLNVKF